MDQDPESLPKPETLTGCDARHFEVLSVYLDCFCKLLRLQGSTMEETLDYYQTLTSYMKSAKVSCCCCCLVAFSQGVG